MTRLTPSHTVVRMRGVIAASALLLGFPSISIAETPAHSVADAPAHSVADAPAVARPVYVAEGHRQTASTVFFLRVEDEIGVAAVGAAHHFDLDAVAAAGEVRFRLGRTQRHVGVSSRYLVTPGRPFSEPGATLGDDYIVFALDAPPHEVRALEASRDAPKKGQRVRILGVPAAIPQDEDDIFGKIVSFAPKRMEVDLDVRADLRGWGGAPVLTYPEGLVVGLLEAQWPEGGSLRLGVAPIGGILEALSQPLDAGRGLPFASVETPAPGVRDELEDSPFVQTFEVPPSPTPQVERRAPAVSQEETDADEAPSAYDDLESAIARLPSEAESAAPAEVGAREPSRLSVAPQDASPTQLKLVVNQPQDGDVIGDDSGAFVAGSAVAMRGELQRYDVIFVLDTSGSTADPTGADINGNGVVGQGVLGGLFGNSDPGDSILAAEVAAARALLKSLDPRSTRVGLVTFAGDPPDQTGMFGVRPARAAVTEEPLTSDYDRVEKTLTRVQGRGAEGLTHMAAGVDQATIELLGLRGAFSETSPTSEKMVLFFTDGQPTLPHDPIFEADNVKAVLRAADRAQKAGIKVHAFAIGPEALEGPISVVELAKRTSGIFVPIRDPADLIAVVEEVNFADIEDLVVVNTTLDLTTRLVITNPDGSWSALVPVNPGRNVIQVTARATDGTEASETVVVQYAPGGPKAYVPDHLVPQRNALLEERLIDLRRDRLAQERTRDEEARKALMITIEEERAAAEQRAAQQSKELDIGVEREENE